MQAARRSAMELNLTIVGARWERILINSDLLPTAGQYPLSSVGETCQPRKGEGFELVGPRAVRCAVDPCCPTVLVSVAVAYHRLPFTPAASTRRRRPAGFQSLAGCREDRVDDCG